MLRALRISPIGSVEEVTSGEISQIPNSRDGSVYWIDLEKPTAEEFASISDPLKFHPLAIEDCSSLERNQPNLYIYDDHYFIIFHTLIREFSETQQLHTEEINFFLGENYLVTHHLEESKAVMGFRKNLDEALPLIKKYGAGFLFYEILDRVADHSYAGLGNIQKQIDRLEESATQSIPRNFFDQLITARDSLLRLRRQVIHERDVVKRLQRGTRELIHPDLKPYFADIQDTLVHAGDLIESEKDNLTSLREIYLSIVSHRLNNTMKVLTTIATIFMPMTLVASIYGMNFTQMPGLDWAPGFWLAMGIMLSIGGLTFLYLRVKDLV